ncbi:MAG: hypothetical protein IPM58_16740 [Nitrospira sp.]|nr:hypothetical protein [Nitrospira sp.]
MHRALQQLGITLIAAYSPEARGRSECAFRTLQNRLPKELALAGITDMAAANVWLRTQFVPAYNQRFAVPATKPDTAFAPWVEPIWPMCSACRRTASSPTTIRCGITAGVQCPPDSHRFHYVKATVRVHEYPDGTLAVFHGPRCLAR